MPQKRLRLVVGLGNPGDIYKTTRHNTGFRVVNEVADFFSFSIEKRKKFPDLIFGRGLIEGIDVLLAKPQAFMNRSGPPVVKLANYFKISSEEVLVIHDDIDLAFGKLKIKEKGGDGGHRGVKSLIDAFGTGDFTRLRIGIGRSGSEISVTDHVLGRFNDDEKMILNKIIHSARDAVVTILCKGVKEGMDRFNNKNITISG